MDIWMKKCVRQAICNYCGSPILNGDYIICGRYWIKHKSDIGTDKGMYRHKNYYWHCVNSEGIHCWEEQAKFAIDNMPVVVSKRGRKKLNLAPEDRKERLRILNSRSTITYKIREELAKPDEDRDFSYLAHLGGELIKMKERIADFGGVPKSWQS